MTSTKMDAAVQSYCSKSLEYFAGTRADLVRQLPDAADAVILEIGCGSGGTGKLALATGKCSSYHGVEIHQASAARAKEVLSDVLVGNVETMDLPYRVNSFDAIIISEVLEHLVDPWQLVERLARLLKPGSQVIATSPNISHWRVIKSLLAGRFEYTGMGVMDRTHLRWFTPSTFGEMFTSAGIIVDAVGPSGGSGRVARAVNLATAGAVRHLFCTQIELHGHRPA